MTEPALSFLSLDVELDDEEHEDLDEICATLERLAQRRKDQISAYSPEMMAMADINLTTYREALLYRVVATASGAIVCWNTGNVLCSFLAARALLETVAILHDLNKAIARALKSRNLHEIDSHTYRKMFATRSEKILSTKPELFSTNVVTFVNALSEEFSEPILRQAYDLMSERCHPNSSGTTSMFAAMDANTGIVTFSDRQNTGWAFRLIYSIVAVVKPAERIFDELDEAIMSVKSLARDKHDAAVQEGLSRLIREASEKRGECGEE
jgi:L-amino acid N-acyltransferase YncA